MPVPQTTEEWKEIARNFKEQWDYPNCIGAIDGKHILILCPDHSGSLYYNYKGTYSVVLMAMVDANYKFIAIDVGSYGRQSDAGTWAHSILGKLLAPPNKLNLPDDCVIVGAEYLGLMPFVAVSDEAFPLQKHIMRPYSGRHATKEQDAYNYRHSRARRIVECAFGILAGRWRVFHTKIAVQPATVNLIVQAATVLHNMLQKQSTSALAVTPAPAAEEAIGGLQALKGLPTRGSMEAIAIRDKFTQYFVDHPLRWQESHTQ